MKNLLASLLFAATIFLGAGTQGLVVTPHGYQPPNGPRHSLVSHPLPGGDLIIVPEGFSPPNRP